MIPCDCSGIRSFLCNRSRLVEGSPSGEGIFVCRAQRRQFGARLSEQVGGFRCFDGLFIRIQPSKECCGGGDIGPDRKSGGDY